MDFGIGFWELCFTALIALIVLGPDKLPGAARTVGLWVGKARRVATTIKSEVERELRVDELRQNILKHNPASEFENLVQETRQDLQAHQRELELSGDTPHVAQSAAPSATDQPATSTATTPKS